MMPPIPKADTTKPMDWHIVTDMVLVARWAGPRRAQASTSRLWGTQPGQTGLLAGGTAYVMDGSQERSGPCHTNLPFPFICFGEIIFLAQYQGPFVADGVNASVSVYLLLRSRGAASLGSWGPGGPLKKSLKPSEAITRSRGAGTEMLKSDATDKNDGEPSPFLAWLAILSPVGRYLLAPLYWGGVFVGMCRTKCSTNCSHLSYTQLSPEPSSGGLWDRPLPHA